MSSRQEMLEKGSQSLSPNPAKRFIEWKSSKECFIYWDKESESNIELKLPLHFVFVQQSYTVGGYSQKNGGWYSNEVLDFGKEKMVARTFSDSKVIAEGLYKDIKPVVIESKVWEGRFYRVVYVINTNKELIAIKLKGGAGLEFGNFFKDNSKKLSNHWISVKRFEERMNGAIKYNVPIFELGAEVKDTSLADDAWGTITSHIQERNKSLNLGADIPDSDFSNSAESYAQAEVFRGVAQEEEELPF